MGYTTRYWVYHIRVTDSRFASHSLGGPYQSHVAAGGCPWVPAELREILGSVPTNSPEYLDNTKHVHPVITWLFYLFYLVLLVLLQVFIPVLLPVSQSYAFLSIPCLGFAFCTLPRGFSPVVRLTTHGSKPWPLTQRKPWPPMKGLVTSDL